MQYIHDETQTITLPESPSLLPNNLTIRHDGDAIAYIHINDVIFVNTVGSQDHNKIAVAAKSHATQVIVPMHIIYLLGFIHSFERS
jgi:hypothetical protein